MNGSEYQNNLAGQEITRVFDIHSASTAELYQLNKLVEQSRAAVWREKHSNQVETPQGEELSSRERELALLRSLENKYPHLGAIQLQCLPPNLFTLPDSASNLSAASDLVTSSATLRDFYAGSIASEHVECPTLENALLAYQHYISQQLFLRSAANPEEYRKYTAQWVADERKQRSSLTDSALQMRTQLDRGNMSNGLHGKVAQAAIHGEAGTGKTELLIRHIKETFARDVVVISIRPHMSSDELIGSLDLVNFKNTSDVQGLITLIDRMSGENLVAALKRVSENFAEKNMEIFQSADDHQDEIRRASLKKACLINQGFTEKTVEQLINHREGFHVHESFEKQLKEELFSTLLDSVVTSFVLV